MSTTLTPEHTRLRAGAVYTTDGGRMKQMPWNVHDEDDEEQSLREAVKRLEARIAELAEKIRYCAKVGRRRRDPTRYDGLLWLQWS